MVHRWPREILGGLFLLAFSLVHVDGYVIFRKWGQMWLEVVS